MAKYKAELYLQNPNGEEFYACSRCGRAFSSKMVQAQPINENGTALYCPHCKTELAGLDHLQNQAEQETPEPGPKLQTIRIYLKNGTVLPDIHCEECETEFDNNTGDLVGLKFCGAVPTRPLYIHLLEVLAVVQLGMEDA